MKKFLFNGSIKFDWIYLQEVKGNKKKSHIKKRQQFSDLLTTYICQQDGKKMYPIRTFVDTVESLLCTDVQPQPFIFLTNQI